MVALSCMELLPEASAGLAPPQLGFCFSCGAGLFVLLAWTQASAVGFLLGFRSTDQDAPARVSKGPRGAAPPAVEGFRAELLASGVLTALGIALHNVPEGASVLIAGAKNPELGLRLALAIALHNVPEGVAVAAPVYVATGSRWTAFKWAALSGVAEPLTAAALAPFAGHLTGASIDSLLAGVAGAMVALALGELLPLAVRQAGPPAAAAAASAGIALVAAQLSFFH